jgi:hypothetical protein
MIRYKTFKTGFTNAVLNDTEESQERITCLSQRVGHIHQLRILAHQFAKYCTIRSYEENVQAPSIFGKNKANGWTAYYSAIAQPVTSITTQGSMRQWYAEFSADLNIVKSEFSNLADQYNSHTAGQSVSLCKKHVSGEYKKHIFHFVRAHFRDEIMKRTTKEERKSMWSCVDTIVTALIDGSAPKRVTSKLRRQSVRHGLMFKTFLDICLASGMFKLFRDADGDDQCDDMNDDDDAPTGISMDEYEQWHKAMWYMSTKIELLNVRRSEDKQLRVRCLIPLVSSIYPKHALIYAKPLIHMLGYSYNAWKTSDTGIHGIWAHILKPNILDGPKSFAIRNSNGTKERYRFVNQITTDGYSGLSLLFVHPHDYARHVRRAAAMGEARQATRGMSDEQLNERAEQQKADQKQKNAERRRKKRAREEEKRKAKKNGYKLPKAGIPYFDSLDPGFVQSKRHIYIDSGHYGHDMIDGNFRCDDADRKSHKMVAEQRYRLHAIGTKRRAQAHCTRERQNRLDVTNCIERERLNSESKYAVGSTHFLNYCKALRRYTSVVVRRDPAYNSWHSYQGLRMYGLRNRYESNLVKSISDKFGSPRHVLVIIGDYSATHRQAMRGTVPAFVVGLGRLLKRSGFHVAWIDEYNTSKLYHATHQEGEQANAMVHRPVDSDGKELKELYRRRWISGQKKLLTPEHASIKQVSRKLHAIKLFKTDCGMKAFCNRDTNAVLNFRYIVQHWLNHGTRPIEYCRGISNLSLPGNQS